METDRFSETDWHNSFRRKLPASLSKPHSVQWIEAETGRLYLLCAAGYLQSAVDEAADRRELLESLADACRFGELIFAAQYLDYLLLPYD
jgi:hypothetical protein